MALPDKIENKTAKAFQNLLYVIGGFMTLAALVAFSRHDGGAGILDSLIAFGLFWAGSKIKTTYEFSGGVGVYR